MDSPGTKHSESASALLLCDEARIANVVQSSLCRICPVSSVPSPDTRILLLYTAGNTPADLLSINNHCRAHPGLYPILITHRPYDHHFETLAHNGIFHVLNVGASSFGEALVSSAGIALRATSPFTLPIIPQIETKHAQFNVLTRQDYQVVLTNFETFFHQQELPPERLWEMRLLLDEAFNNALFHSFHDEDDMEKYSHETFTGLYDADLIKIELIAQGTARSILMISDNSGTLDAHRVLAALNRQISRNGIFDHRGRGLYLMRRLSDRMVINISPGHSTQIQLYFNHHLSPAWKNLEINIIESS